MKIDYTDNAIRVHFADHGVPFELTTAVCTNPDCDCREMSLYLKAQTDANLAAFSLTVGLDDWKERNVPDREAPFNRWANELLDGLTEEDKQTLYSLYDAKFAQKRLQDCILSPDEVLSGALIAYSGIVSEEKSICDGGTTCIARFVHGGTEYAMDALYCSNPDCHCDEAHLLFVRLMPAPNDPSITTNDAYVRVRLMFDGNWRIEERRHLPMAAARSVFTAWINNNPRITERFREEYEAIKAVGRHSLEVATKTARAHHAPRVREQKIGRNAPCICGSGKKYKKCCGA